MAKKINVCMVGHGMMGVWHSEPLQSMNDVRLHTVVGRKKEGAPANSKESPRDGIAPPSTEIFADQWGYKNWTTDFDEALSDKDINCVIIAGPSESHAEMAMKSIEAGKNTLVEIPIAMNLEQSEAVVNLAEEKGVTLGVVHPMRFRTERNAIIDRVRRGEEKVSHVHGRFFISRLTNVGATGLQRSWTDNLLWHHTTHLVDFGLWINTGDRMDQAEEMIESIDSVYSPIEPRTGIPMELVTVIKLKNQATIVTTGSYYSGEFIYDTLVVSDWNSYRTDERRAMLTTREGEMRIATEQANAALIAPDFVRAIQQGRQPRVPGRSVLPTMRVLSKIQDDWDAVWGKQLLPGRPVM